ncbi:hypothetical protein Hanom_Chr01g00082721 [Helianthus anomalus]
MQTLVHTGTVTVESDMKQELVLIDLIEEFEELIGRGFNRKIQDLILRSKVFTKLESILCERSFSNAVPEASAFAIAEWIRFNKNVFVGQVSISKIVCVFISLTTVRLIQILCTLIRSLFEQWRLTACWRSDILGGRKRLMRCWKRIW